MRGTGITCQLRGTEDAMRLFLLALGGDFGGDFGGLVGWSESGLGRPAECQPA